MRNALTTAQANYNANPSHDNLAALNSAKSTYDTAYDNYTSGDNPPPMNAVGPPVLPPLGDTKPLH